MTNWLRYRLQSDQVTINEMKIGAASAVDPVK
jgi:hypothetical protein